MSPNNPKKRRFKAKGVKKAITLLEHEGHVENYVKRFKEIKGQKLIIALSPFAMYELDKQGLPYNIPEDYYNSGELYKLGINNYKKVENLCGIIDERIQNACPTVAKLDIRPVLFNFYHLKNIYDAATIRLFQLSKLIDAEKPDILYVYDSRRYPFGISEMAPYLFFDKRESIYARLLACRGWSISATVLPHVPYPDNADISKKPQSKVKIHKKGEKWLYRYPKLFDFAVEIQRRGWSGFLGWLKSYLRVKKGIQVLLFGAGYNWDDCRDELRSAGIDSCFIRIRDDLERWMSNQIPSKLDVGALSSVWSELQADNEFRKFFIWDGIDFLSVLEERIRFMIEHLTLACLNAHEEAVRIIKKRKVKGFLASTLESCTSRSAAEAARKCDIPVVTWQHGGYGYMDHPMVAYNDLMSSDVHFVFGEGVVDKYAKLAKHFDTQLVSIGSSSLETLFRMPQSNKAKKIAKLGPRKKVVLYATTNFLQNNLYISFPPPYSDNNIWRTQCAILDVLAKHDNCTTVVKVHPNPLYRDPPMRLYAKENKLENCQFIKDEYTFTNMLPIADLIMIDTPSTTLLQALTISNPIFVYTGHLRLDAHAQKMLNQRAFCYRDLKGLADALDKYLSKGKIDKRVSLKDKKFLKTYGISSQGKGGGLRATKMLKKIM